VTDEPARRAPRQPPALVVRTLGGYGTNVATAFLSLLNVLVIARTLGPAGRGDVAFLTTVAVLTSQFATLGIQQATANLGGAEPDRRPSLATNSVVFALTLSGAAVLAVSGLIWLVPAAGGDAPARIRWLAYVAIPGIILWAYLQTLVQSAYTFVVIWVLALLVPLTILSANVALAAAGELTVGRAVAAWTAGQIISTLVLVWHVAFRGDGFGRPSLALARRMVGFGLKVHPGIVMSFGSYRLDHWLVGSISGSRELGLYSVAVAWSEGLFFLPNSIASAQRPDLVRATPEAAYRQAVRVHRLAQLVTLVLAAGVIVAAEPLCVGVFGSDFRGSVEDLRILALGGFGIVALKLFGDALTAQRKPVLESLAIGATFAATVGLDLVLIPAFGGVGAAIASTLAYSVGGVAVGLIFWRTLRGGERRR
jgi:O-antigen/teichoic acid export membrane protein